MVNLDEVMQRVKQSGLSYHMKEKFEGSNSTGERLTAKLWNMMVS